MPTTEPELRCAAQHFGPWMIEPEWFGQAVAAVKAGVFRAEAVRDSSGSTLYNVDGNGIATVSITGHMMKGESSFGGASTIKTRQALRAAAADERVKGVMMLIDSPGGSVAGTAELAAEVAATDAVKPVHAFGQDLMASAAYWVGSQARRVTASAITEVGSLGTVAVVEDSSGAMDKRGIVVHVISTGDYKGVGVDGAPISEQHLAYLRDRVNAMNQHFMDGVQGGRKLAAEQVKAIWDGKVHPAAGAKSIGLIDGVQTFDQAMAELAAAVKGSAPVQAPTVQRRRAAAAVDRMNRELFLLTSGASPR